MFIKAWNFELDKRNAEQVMEEMKSLSTLELKLSKNKLKSFFVERIVQLFETLLEWFRSRSDSKQEDDHSTIHYAGWYVIRHLLDIRNADPEGQVKDIAEILEFEFTLLWTRIIPRTTFNILARRIVYLHLH